MCTYHSTYLCTCDIVSSTNNERSSTPRLNPGPRTWRLARGFNHHRGARGGDGRYGASAPGAFFGRANAREVAAADALASGDAATADAAYAAAVDDYGSCLALAPDAPDAVFAVFERAQAERALRRWEDARRDYDRAAEAFLGRREKKRSDLCAAQAAFAAFEAGDVAAARARLETLARRLYSSDVRAALVAVRWSEGDVGGAESLWLELCQLEGAACGKYADEAWVESYRRWTPGLAKRVGDFLALRGGGGETYEP